MTDASKGKTSSLFLIGDLTEGFSTFSFSFFLFFFEGRSFTVSSLLPVFATSFWATTLLELVSPALMVKDRKWILFLIKLNQWARRYEGAVQCKKSKLTSSWESPTTPGNWNLIDRVKTSKAAERAIPDMMHAAGASTSISRTCNKSQNNVDTLEKKKN